MKWWEYLWVVIDTFIWTVGVVTIFIIAISPFVDWVTITVT